jgi:transcriptional regulator with XRE-family HTH domain
MTECFGDLLCRLRLDRLVEVERATGRKGGGITRYITTTLLSQGELARRSGIDPASVNRYEAGRKHPSRADAERLAAGLDLGDEERARLLVAAGYWPWPDLDPEAGDFVLAAALAIVAGDWRRAPALSSLDPAQNVLP